MLKHFNAVFVAMDLLRTYVSCNLMTDRILFFPSVSMKINRLILVIISCVIYVYILSIKHFMYVIRLFCIHTIIKVEFSFLVCIVFPLGVCTQIKPV